jgi:MoxR-like ATPase
MAASPDDTFNPAAMKPDDEIRRRLQATEDHLNSVVLGQPQLVRGMLLSLICGGHVLIEGVPGLAKTTAVAALAATIQTTFRRLQFTPDLLPSDIIGSEIYRPDEHSFEVQRGPIFANLILVDEVNRAPAKVQSALLEAMQERQVSIAGQTMPLPAPFMVLATQNPIDQQGTYTLPEAQMDRFLLKILVDYPSPESERSILHRSLQGQPPAENSQAILSSEDIAVAREATTRVRFTEPLQKYVLDLVQATRRPHTYSSKSVNYIRFGVSPRGTLALAHAARAFAFLSGRDYVNPDDVKSVLYDVFRHRIVLSYEALAEDQSADGILQTLVQHVPVP